MKERSARAARVSAGFIEPMLCLAVPKIPEGPEWQYELKLDGYRAIGVRTKRGAELWSRNQKDFSRRFASVTHAFESLPVDTVVDGEIVAVDEYGRPCFNSLQNFDRSQQTILFFAFDLLLLGGKDLRNHTLDKRRDLLRELITGVPDPIRHSDTFDVPAQALLQTVREHGLEGVVAKRRDSRYECGRRSGAWVKFRANRRQEFVIGGYVPSLTSFDSILVGCYEGKELKYAASVRAGFVPASRQVLFEAFEDLLAERCPFRNLPEVTKGRWGTGITEAEMEKCRWVRPQLVAAIEFLEWTPENRLRHPRFTGLREDVDAQQVRRE